MQYNCGIVPFIALSWFKALIILESQNYLLAYRFLGPMDQDHYGSQSTLLHKINGSIEIDSLILIQGLM